MLFTKSYAQKWNYFFFRSCPPHALALLRIIFGLFIFFQWLIKTPYISMMFSNEGLSIPFRTFASPLLTTLLSPPSSLIAWTLFTLFLITLLLFTIGAGFRTSITLILLLYAYYHQIGLHAFFMTFERLYVFVFFVLLWSGADQTLSYRSFHKYGSIFAWEPISIFPQRLLALQISATYLGVGWQKLILPAWQGGEILSYSLVSMWGTRFGHWLAGLNLPISFYDAANWLLKFLQFLLPLGLWIPKWQWLFFVGGAIFHVTIAATISMWWFLIMVPAYIVFLEPEKVYVFLKNRVTMIP